VRVIIQPGDGVMPLVRGIDSARKSIELVIFRFDRSEIERALKSAVSRGVFVHALIAYTNRGGEKNLRKLEAHLLAAGVTVARTDDNLIRYHDKFMIVDRKLLYVLAFNSTYLDIDHSRSFGVITRNRGLVQEAVKLFEADTKRQPYTPGLDAFVVSPANARKQLSRFIRGARKQLLIYDPKVNDADMVRLLEDRARAGVEVRIIGRLTRKSAKLPALKLPQLRLHTRTTIRDGHQAFVGSQSLREIELDARREVGIIFRDPKAVSRLVKTFEEDWARAESSGEQLRSEQASAPVAKVTKKIVKAIAKELPPVAPVVEEAVKEVVGNQADIDLDAEEVEETVKDAVKESLREAIQDMVEEVVEQKEDGGP
jgi:phosphatidylserine/phosphatidylglycerophosphate/cardiolipin synthase-like enzyme